MARQHLSAAKLLRLVGGKALAVPPGGWHAANFATHGTALLVTLHRLANVVQRRAIPEVARRADKVFRLQLEKVIAKVLARTHGKASGIFVEVGGMETLWARALNEVFAESGEDLVAEIMPPIQSVMAQGWSKTDVLLAQDTEAAEIAANVARKARGIASRITRINDTTRNTFEKVIRSSIEDGLTTGETAKVLRETLPQVNVYRQLTIARTELNNAWTQGSVESMQGAGTLTHVSVIGCSAREPKSPQFRGESTCNIQDVAKADTDALLKVGWHINHTGTVVPSRFANEDGSQDGSNDRPAVLDAPPEGDGGTDQSALDKELEALGLRVS